MPAPAHASSMTDNEWMVVIGVILIVLQFLYRLWDNKDNKAILEAITTVVKGFDPHVERTKRTHGMVKDLKRMHDVHDDDGRPIWYTPKEVIETQRELVKINNIVATTQSHMTKLLDRVETKIDDHKDACKMQFSQLDKKVGGVS